MRVSIEEVVPRTEDIWTAKIDPQHLLRLAKPVRLGDRLSVIFVRRPSYDMASNVLQFDLESAVLLNLGNTFDTIFIDSGVNESLQTEQSGQTKAASGGDLFFLDELRRLGEAQRQVGEELLKEVRKEYPGELKYHQKSGKFVESPDNFWVVRIQPRADSLRIIVYGRPEEHGHMDTIELKRDMWSYTTFVIDSHLQIPDALDVIRNAKRLKDMR